ncbi:hypothetical protein ACIBEA_43060 [Streptomyces sp. NPDC051555]|uniref:hypothetical protein n=1 Tax=Streptomyces sp. NPDC051555 TaxID=3365657 RepID=UPI0037881AC9
MRRAVTATVLAAAALIMGAAAAHADGPTDALGGLGGLTNLDPGSLGQKADSTAGAVGSATGILGGQALESTAPALGSGLPTLG